MKADWLNEFRGELELLRESSPSVLEVVVHHRSRDVWHSGEIASSTPDFLDKVISSPTYKKIGKQKRYAFPLPDVDVIVEISFNVFPKSSSLNALGALVEQTKENSRHKFDALHDSLTGCKNRKSFDKAIVAAVSSLSHVKDLSGTSLTQGPAASVSLITIDIDFFKRINDSRGHDYGDLVLRAFSWKIRDLCECFADELPAASVELFRLGGEEFNILIVGERGERDVLEWARVLQKSIEHSVIPHDEQIDAFNLSEIYGMQLPSINERRVTASFGVSRVTGVVSDKDRQVVIDRLKTQADKALYCSKNSGRNRVTYFPDILKRFGRVLEHDKSAGIVVVDIGSEVGVVKGREFFVIPERYTGEVPYIIDDGRSRRSLGNYPRIKNAKVVAFDVQEQISFCSIAERRDGVDITEGSLLESIPLGLFGGLSGFHGYSDSLGDPEPRQALQKWLAENDQERGRVVAIRFPTIREVDKKHGSVKANEILAGASAAAKRLLPPPVKVVQTEIGQFGVAFFCDAGDVQKYMDEIITALRELCIDVVDFTIGVFDQGAIDSVVDEGFSLDVAAAYEYATIAAAAAQNNSWRVFDSSAPDEVMKRNEGDYEKVLADYKRFKELGIGGANFENMAGIAYFGTGLLESSSAAFRAAVGFDDSDAIIRSNLAIVQYLSGRELDAYDQFVASNEIDNNYPSASARAAYAVCALESHVVRGQPDLNVVSDLFNAVDQGKSGSFLRQDTFDSAKVRLALLMAEQTVILPASS